MDGALGGYAQVRLQLGKSLLDGVEVGAVRREVAQGRARRLDQLAHDRTLVAGQVAHHDDVAGVEFGDEHLAYIGDEDVAVDRAVEHHGNAALGRDTKPGGEEAVRAGADW